VLTEESSQLSRERNMVEPHMEARAAATVHGLLFAVPMAVLLWACIAAMVVVLI
jgi:hypothetical protein